MRMRASRGPARQQPWAATPVRRLQLAAISGSANGQTHPAAFLGRFSPLLEAEYLNDVADAGLRALAT
jgi:hypothetical protein